MADLNVSVYDSVKISRSLCLNGSGYASIADGSQAGLDMGYSDFMVGIWIKTSSAAIFPIIYKGGAGGYFDLHLNATTGYLECKINDGTNTATITGDIALNDDEWHLVRVTIDKSSATGGRLYVDGSEDTSARTDVTSVLDIDNDGTFYLGYDGSNFAVNPKFDELEIWNFGYGGLPADYANYISWRYTHPHDALSEYDSGAWNGYADADRTEKMIDPGIENWTGDTPDNWTQQFESAGVRDITDEQVETHGGSHAAKIEVTNNDGTSVNLLQPNKTLVANKYYEMSAWVYFPTRTAGIIQVMLWNATDGTYASITLTSTNAAYGKLAVVGIPTVAAGNAPNLKFIDETTTGIVYFDDASLKRVGLVAHYKFNGDYTDETSNSNDLTAGGSGNLFDELEYGSFGRNLHAFPNIYDSTSITENIGRNLHLFPSVYDSVSIAEYTKMLLHLFPSVNDATSIAEVISMFTDKLYFSTYDTVTITEYIKAKAILAGISVNDSISIAEAISSIAILYDISIIETLSVSDKAYLDFWIQRIKETDTWTERANKESG